MAGAIELTKSDVRNALLNYQLQRGSVVETFERLRSVQFDPLQPVGCNHDLVLQARVKNYKVGDWQKAAYKERAIYDGWDKMASLVAFSGWPLRRLLHQWRSTFYDKMLEEHPDAIDAVLKELEKNGPLAPKDFEFQLRRDDWHGSWYGPSVTKRALRALWHTGRVMTTSRKGQHHIYDLTERVVPAQYLNEPLLSEDDAYHQLLLERHQAMGLIRPNAPFEVWSSHIPAAERRASIRRLVDRGHLVEVSVEGVTAFAAPAFMEKLGEDAPNQVTFVGPLDQIMWDRKMIEHLFGFEYIWEVYVPEAKRRWGYYVLPIVYGDQFVARMDTWARKGVLEIRAWHWEQGKVPARFWPAFEKSMLRFMSYCGAKEIVPPPNADEKLRQFLASVSAESQR